MSMALAWVAPQGMVIYGVEPSFLLMTWRGIWNIFGECRILDGVHRILDGVQRKLDGVHRIVKETEWQTGRQAGIHACMLACLHEGRQTGRQAGRKYCWSV